jgi:hypothetical protein
VSNVAKLISSVLERDALSVNKILVLVLVQVPATAKLPPRLRVVFEVVKVDPLTNVAPLGRLRAPPVEEKVPAVALIPPLRVKSAAPVTIFSPAASSVTGCAMLSLDILSSSVKVKLAKSSVPTDREALSLIVEFAASRSVVELSGTTPLKFCTPATSRMPPESVSALAFVVNVVFFVFRVAPVSDKAFCSTNVVSGSEILVPDGALAPEPRVIVPPEEFSDALSVNANAPERVRLPAPVSRAIPDKARASFTFR